MIKAKKNIKHINSFLDTNTIGMTDDEFQKHDKLFQKELAKTVDLKKLVDYFRLLKISSTLQWQSISVFSSG